MFFKWCQLITLIFKLCIKDPKVRQTEAVVAVQDVALVVLVILQVVVFPSSAVRHFKKRRKVTMTTERMG